MHFDPSLLRHLRREQGLSQTEFAEKIGVTAARVQQSEASLAPVNVAYLRTVFVRAGLDPSSTARDLRTLADKIQALGAPTPLGEPRVVGNNVRIQPVLQKALRKAARDGAVLHVDLLVDRLHNLLPAPPAGVRDRRKDRVRNSLYLLVRRGEAVIEGDTVREPADDLC